MNIPCSFRWTALIVLGALLCGCDGARQVESDRLDQFLANSSSNVDTVVLGSIYETNYLSGRNARAFLAALHKTNRIPVALHGRVEFTGWVVLRSNTNELFHMGIFDGYTYTLGKYCFEIQTLSLPLISDE